MQLNITHNLHMKSSRAQRGKELIIGPGNKQVRINNELASACVCVCRYMHVCVLLGHILRILACHAMQSVLPLGQAHASTPY